MPEDEYDGYLNVVASKLKRGNGRDDISEYLTNTLAEDAVVPDEWKTACDQTAQALLDWYSSSDAP